MEQSNGTILPDSYLEPTVTSCYGHGLQQLKKYFLELLLITLLMGVISAPLGLADAMEDRDTFLSPVFGMFALFYYVLIVGPVGFGVAYAFLKAARGEKVDIKDMFAFQGNYLNAVLANLLTDFFIVIGLFFFIIPGIFIACKLAFVPYLVIDRNMGAVDAVRESWRLTGGYAFKIFLMGLLAIFIALAGLILFLVGVIVAVMWIDCTFASLYYAVTRMRGSGTDRLEESTG